MSLRVGLMLLSGPALTLPDRLDALLEVGLVRDPDGPALQDLHTSLSWRQLAERVERLTAAYGTMPLKAGDRVASLMPNRVELVIHYLACLRLGLVITPLNYRYVVPEIDHALRVSGAVLLLYHQERLADLEATQLAGSLPLGLIRFEDGQRAAGAEGERCLETLLTTPATGEELSCLPAEAPAIIYFTSGSTAKPKGVTHSRASYGATLASLAQVMEYAPGERLMVGCSLAHAAASMYGLAGLSLGVTLVVATESDNHALEALLHHRQPNLLLMLPAPLMGLMHDRDLNPADFADVRLCLSGGDKVPLQLQRDFKTAVGFSIDECFGMSECGVATMSPPSGENRVGSVGRVCPGFECSIRNEEGRELPVGAEGRLWLRSASVMTGYWDNPTATAETIVDGWLDTGDEMRLDADGYLWFCGRRKQIIVHDASNICPQDVEDALCEHPAVELAGAIGIHDVMHGENVRAYITLQRGAQAPMAAELIRFARERIGYKAPEEIVVLAEMPLNPSGKVDRVALKAMAAEAPRS
ncbi:class I adenylate-forming enzyme family protein [Synechococcus sp. CCY9201]|uniref:class I adenylate-forming enzyme family protein n=2 Tax=Synechococcus TaxID=1129 RepID=UPI002B1EA843|nr:class I adenylate-forming enzyme family protein [Synechococcus sp. CCY9202]MEA5474549.1 class I adenylate-forming enzyme family protein [Synechococcus sp. CCY9201]